jgi:Terminase large subunit, T4likevirus-type, N-terminal
MIGQQISGTEIPDRTSQILKKNEWKPNPKQRIFLGLPYTIKEGMYGGGAGSGKSDVLLLYGIVHRFHENPRFKQVFMRRTFPELRNEILPRSREIYPKFGATLNKTEMIWTFPREDQYGSGYANSGAMIFLGQCENESDVHKYDTMEICLFTPDEITSLTEYIYLYIAFERNRAPKHSGLPSITRAAGMPGGVGHTFTKKRFIDPAPQGGVKLVGKGGNKRIYIHATQHDNKENIDPTYEQSLQGRPEAEKKAKLYGDWTAYQGLVFEEFRTKRYPDEPENALHCIPPFVIPEYWPRIVIGDWGFRAMCWIGHAAISPWKRVYVYREQVFQKVKIEEWAPEVKYWIDREYPRVVKFCQSAAQERGQEHTIQEQIAAALQRPIDLSQNSAGSRVAGKLLLHEYLRWKPKPVLDSKEIPPYDHEYALWIFRNKGEQAYNSYLALFEPLAVEDNIPKLQIFLCDPDKTNHEFCPNCCPRLVEAIQACNYAKPKGDKPAEDVAEFEGDDPYDGIRYLLDEVERFFEVAADEFKRVQREQELIEKLNNSQDWTAFYRNMRTLESHNKIQAVSRYHRRR